MSEDPSLKISHDINNELERLSIIHRLLKKKDFSTISREEILEDIQLNTDELKKNFLKLFELTNTDQ